MWDARPGRQRLENRTVPLRGGLHGLGWDLAAGVFPIAGWVDRAIPHHIGPVDSGALTSSPFIDRSP